MDEILKDVYTWSVFSEEKKLNFNGYFIPTQHALFGNVVIDPPPVSDLDLAQMETLGSVQQILITNEIISAGAVNCEKNLMLRLE